MIAFSVSSWLGACRLGIKESLEEFVAWSSICGNSSDVGGQVGATCWAAALTSDSAACWCWGGGSGRSGPRAMAVGGNGG